MKPQEPNPNLKPLERTEEDLERLAEITPDDVTDAALWFRRGAGEMGGLIDAEEENDE